MCIRDRAGAVAILMLMFFEGVLVGGVGLLVIGVPPTGEEILRLVSYLLLTSFYTMLWLGLAMLFSVLCKHAATSAPVSYTHLWKAVMVGSLRMHSSDTRGEK